jgi:hypothetical protein
VGRRSGRDGELAPHTAGARAAIARIRALDAPDPTWAALQQNCLTEMERWIAARRHTPHEDQWGDLQAGLDALDERRKRLRDLS